MKQRWPERTDETCPKCKRDLWSVPGSKLLICVNPQCRSYWTNCDPKETTLERVSEILETDADLKERSLLSDRAILRNLEKGNIVIEPFSRENLGTCSYDLRLGEYYYRETKPPKHPPKWYNPYSELGVARVWGSPLRALRSFSPLEGIPLESRVIWIEPRETILAHTQEFIGGRSGIITTMMKARSTWGRNFIEVCKCAGWGDVGYTNRWTMEITNNSRFYLIPLLVGVRIAQMAFFRVEPILESDYPESGKYQDQQDIEEVKGSWSPKDMLPRLYQDRELRRDL